MKRVLRNIFSKKNAISNNLSRKFCFSLNLKNAPSLHTQEPETFNDSKTSDKFRRISEMNKFDDFLVQHKFDSDFIANINSQISSICLRRSSSSSRQDSNDFEQLIKQNFVDNALLCSALEIPQFYGWLRRNYAIMYTSGTILRKNIEQLHTLLSPKEIGQIVLSRYPRTLQMSVTSSSNSSSTCVDSLSSSTSSLQDKQLKQHTNSLRLDGEITANIDYCENDMKLNKAAILYSPVWQTPHRRLVHRHRFLLLAGLYPANPMKNCDYEVPTLTQILAPQKSRDFVATLADEKRGANLTVTEYYAFIAMQSRTMPISTD